MEQVNTENSICPSQTLYQKMKTRRTVRRFSQEEIPMEHLRSCLKIAGSAPSGANSQPWFFSVVTSCEVKKQIRLAAEREEKIFYEEKASLETLKDLAPFKTDWRKPHLEEAPVLIVIFYRLWSESLLGVKSRSYYPKESTGIATGFLISALHLLGYSSLTHTPQPMKFLNQILQRPSFEVPFLILAVGKAHPDFRPPSIQRKADDELYQVIG